MSYIKRFSEWFRIKPHLDNLQQSPHFSPREVWSCHWGVNVGFELDGKQGDFLRPVLILKKLSRNTFIGIPLTSQLKEGSWYHPSMVRGREGRYILAQVRVIDAKRLHHRIERIDPEVFNTVRQAFKDFI